MKWTDKQQQVIDSRNCNLLVSAAAGSGKTAVLVERIIQLICDENHPIDIDRLLVMTFTNAAAAEMRERISQAVLAKLEEHPESSHLQVQAALVHRAQIMTIDSFCLSLIRDHFNVLDIDPAFRIGDEGELMLLRADVMEELLEEYYNRGDHEFERFVDTYATGKSDSGIEDYIMQVYTFAQSNPFPEEWFDSCRGEIKEIEEGHLESTVWIEYLMRDVTLQIKELLSQLQAAMEVCAMDGGLEVYLPTLRADYEMMNGLAAAGDYETLNSRLKSAAFGRMAAARKKDIDPGKKEYVTACRDRYKKAVGNLKELYGQQTAEEAVSHILGSRDTVLKLLELAQEFARRYQEKKREKNIVDFNDLEHYALQILVKKENGALVYSMVADELSERYAEILVDEYQDSNDVQETLIQSLSGERFGRPNVFMVGDVKQSIYKFRLARPELFMKKYETYEEWAEDGLMVADSYGERGDGRTDEPGTDEETKSAKGKTERMNRKIELHQNFRSRKSVLDSVNAVFYQIMTKNLGGIEYTQAAALHSGAVFADTEKPAGTATELFCVDTGKDAVGAVDEELEDYTSREIEAKLIASRIRQLTDPVTGLYVWDKTREEYRLAEYGDMVILLRSVTGWTDSFINVLTQEGIPAVSETGTGYFDTIEVETVLDMLSVIDNPMQDIPLAAVLKSAIVGMTEEELAWMTAVFKKCAKKGQDRGIYGAMGLVIGKAGQAQEPGVQWRTEARKTGVPESIQSSVSEKIETFQKLLTELRREAVYLPIHELIHRMYLMTGYYEYVSAMPAGKTRQANLDMLIEKASAYEKTSYKGVFQFIRYIEKLKKYDTDFGEASSGQSEQMVRIMSIHKSKGLEFPIVFLAGLGKSFNKQDMRGKLIIDADLGIGTDYLNLDTRVKTSTLKKNVLKRKTDLDNLGEELRVLYVAMTRAKEKLIMTATDRYLQKKLERWSVKTWESRQIPYTILTSAGSYLDWILMAQPQNSELFEVKQISAETLVGEEVARQVTKAVSKTELEQLDLQKTYDAGMRDFLQQQFSHRYLYEEDINLHTKISVSELKKQGQDIDDKNSLFQPVIPEFLKETLQKQEEKAAETKEVAAEMEEAADTEETTETKAAAETEAAETEERELRSTLAAGAARGSAYHRVLELLDFAAVNSRRDVDQWMKKMAEEGKMGEDLISRVNPGKIWRFIQTPLGQRMRQAQMENRLFKESQFVMGIPARDMGQADSDELVLIQGIIDAYIEEPDGLVLIDYKTDWLLPGQEEILKKRYRVQLDYYEKALRQITKKNVKERIIYSLTLQTEVRT